MIPVYRSRSIALNSSFSTKGYRFFFPRKVDRSFVMERAIALVGMERSLSTENYC
ncbi:MAG: hypothetical protein HC894_11420 [Microcoleus sp. SM1_3_4]|nr:hypothetical protein [Microcoleus sp. SM1_3_4]